MNRFISDIRESEWQAYVSLAGDYVRYSMGEGDIALLHRALFDAATIFLRGGIYFDDEVVNSMNELHGRGIEAACYSDSSLDMSTVAVSSVRDIAYWAAAQAVVLPKLKDLHPIIQARKGNKTPVADLVSGAIYLDWPKARSGPTFLSAAV